MGHRSVLVELRAGLPLALCELQEPEEEGVVWFDPLLSSVHWIPEFQFTPHWIHSDLKLTGQVS